MRLHRLSAAVLGVVLAVTGAGCGGGAPQRATSTTSAGAAVSTTTSVVTAAGAALPNTPAGIQARWVLTAWSDLPIPSSAAHQHFDTTFLAAVSVTQLNASLQSLGQPRLVSVLSSQPASLTATVATAGGSKTWTLKLSVDAQGLIDGLLLTPESELPASPTTWAGVDTQLESVAPHVRLLVAELANGSCRAIHSVDPTTPAPLGSMFKLYVLDALTGAVSAGTLSWTQDLTVTSAVKSLPSGTLQDDADGTRVTVTDAATKMISISDNTAANMLLAAVGRQRVEAALSATHMHEPALDTPFLTTRELFTLKLDDFPNLAARYISSNATQKAAMLSTEVDTMPLPSTAQAAAWTSPRDIDSIEWYASAQDICGVYSSLASAADRPGLAPVGQIMEVNDGGLGLNPAQWTRTWFKGGSEPGVLTLSYLATTTAGHTYVVVALAENPAAAIDETTAAPKMLSAIKGAFQLAAGGQ